MKIKEKKIYEKRQVKKIKKYLRIKLFAQRDLYESLRIINYI